MNFFLSLCAIYLFFQKSIERPYYFIEENGFQTLVCTELVQYASWADLENHIIPFSIPVCKGVKRISYSSSQITLHYVFGQICISPRKSDFVVEDILVFKPIKCSHIRKSYFGLKKELIIYSNIGEVYLVYNSLYERHILFPLLGNDWKEFIRDDLF